MKKQEGLLIVEEKVDDFNRNESTYLSKNFQETEARTRFIDPLFTALGWELEQTSLNRQFWDVHREFSQRDDSSTKKPDYAFRIKEKGAPHNKYKEKFFVEAKAPWVPLTDAKPVFQAKRYAFSSHGKAPIVILTDFQEFRVFNGLERPRFENPLQGLIKELDLKYTDYSDKWDMLWANFSKEAVYDGSIDTLAGKVSRSTKTLDDEFLNDIIEWRETLARNVAIRNTNLSVDEINEAVQRILDRFVFIRNLEDRNIEDENLLINLVDRQDDGDAHFYKCIVPVFRKFDIDYNGLLFKKHFSEELEIDNKVIKDIIKSMSAQVSPFRFDIIEPEILGRIYERFLGSKIRLTEDHHAKVEEKPEVRHAGGVYYTPEYIVKYIVENTVGEKVKSPLGSAAKQGAVNSGTGLGLTPEEIEQIKILDPACGSGSFLLGAFDYLIKYHQDYYSGLSKTVRKKYKDDFFETPDGEIRLTLRKKGKILKNNIFGVDIDREATEVAIMSLYLKLLDEGFDKGQALLFMKGHILPDMTDNVKCGNSLIGTDYFEGQLAIDKDEWKKVNPFDWEKEFPDVFSRKDAKGAENEGGFDVVIGNPPYIRINNLVYTMPKEVNYIKINYKSASFGKADIYVSFIEKGISILTNNGSLGYITPNKFFQSDYGINLRNIIIETNTLDTIIDFSSSQVFENALTYTCLLFLSKNQKTNFRYSIINKNETPNEFLNNIKFEIKNKNTISEKTWDLTKGSEEIIFNKIISQGIPLNELADLLITGIKTGANDIFIFNQQSIDIVDKELLHPFWKAENIKRYYSTDSDLYLLYPYELINRNTELLSLEKIKNNYQKTYNYLLSHQKELEQRQKGKLKGDSWYGLSFYSSLYMFNSNKIVTATLSKNNSFTIEQGGHLFPQGAGGGCGIIIKDNIDVTLNYVLGILNSTLISFFFTRISSTFSSNYYAYEPRYLRRIPIKLPEDTQKSGCHNQIDSLVNQMLLTQKSLQAAKTDQEKAMLIRQAEMLDRQIDKLVYELYGLTEEEIKVVEGEK